MIMQKIKEYLSSPATWIAFCVFLFWLGWTYVSLNDRMWVVEKQLAEVNIMEIHTTLAQIQKDIEWIKFNMNK